MIEAKNLTKKYKNQVVLDIPEIKITKGEFVAITGESGSGKSTLLNMLSGLDRPTTGEVLVDGVNIARLRDRKLSKFRSQKIGFVFQFFYLQPFLRVISNIEVAAFPTRIKRKIRKQQAVKMAENVGLGDKLDSFPRELSGGQIQRVAIARALMNNPEILFADEPTGNLDSENSQQIIQLFEKINQETGMTIILVTHSPELASHADRIVHLKDGKIC
jgi:ABC-type lipoprotein export system ATPase subunit